MKNITVALAGNPNVGKSTVFNALTGLHQHTGNWTGKTVSSAIGTHTTDNAKYNIIDLPGTYSLFSSSKEEEVTRDFIYFEKYDSIICVLDATCLERNLNLVLQILEFSPKVAVCVNLLDEAQKKHISIDLDELSLQLCAPVVGSCARSKKGLKELIECVENEQFYNTSRAIEYDEKLEKAIALLENDCKNLFKKHPSRWLSLRFLENETDFIESFSENIRNKTAVQFLLNKSESIRKELNLNNESIRDMIVNAILKRTESIAKICVKSNSAHESIDRKLDRVFTSKFTGIPIMLVMLMLIFWLTIYGANYPSQLLSRFFEKCILTIESILIDLNVNTQFKSFLCDGVLSTVADIISVMLPPMAIFFPLFTILEDFGYLPRVAFNLDKLFQKSGTNGKQSLTMCMGLGCNACGVTGCRIIDSERERSIAVMTNSFIPCNGKFPTLIAIITMFFASSVKNGFLESIIFSIMLTMLILLGIFSSLICSKFLSSTILKGSTSHFTLELPPYRIPQFGKVIVRSIFDRTVFVLLRALIAAIPAGALIWIFANVNIGNSTILESVASFLDPFASFFGLDGVILLSFILGFPANEIVFPIILMAYTASGSPIELGELNTVRELLISNDWTYVTAICTLIFTLLHFPCATTCMTIFKETKSIKKTLISIVLPTAFGLFLCAVVSHLLAFF